MKFYKVSWEELEQDCFKLAKKINKYKFDRILCISRGGLVWARMFSDLLGNLPVSHLTVVSYQDLKQQKEVKITETPAKLKNERLLVVDEIDDTGKTLKIIKNYLRSLNIKKYFTLAPIIRSFSDPKPDFYLKIIDDWIIYPYELKETYLAFLKVFKSKSTAKKMLVKYGFDKKLVYEL
ncbi:hypothetical protein HZA76_00505 [Candidatus Roizmanbacteria bacterium]|nr:hypothetical protein [Candidatus Roizmanbacteria bacterium]